MSKPAWAFSFVVATWTMAIMTYATVQTFSDVTAINGSVTTALAAVLGVPTAAAGIAAIVRKKHVGDSTS